MQENQYSLAGLHVLEKGPVSSRPPIVLVHGACHGAWCWENWIDRLSGRGWHCYALSLRNHEGSYKVEPEIFFKSTFVGDYAADIKVLSTFIGRPCVIMGHSMGGIAVQKYVSQRFTDGMGEMGMVLMASIQPGNLGTPRNKPVPTDIGYLPSMDAARKYLFAKAEEEVIKMTLARLTPESPSVINEYNLSPGIQIDASKVPCPTLVISAELDHSTVPTDNRIAEFYGADFHLAKDVGHDLMLESGWEKPLDVVASWLEKHFG